MYGQLGGDPKIQAVIALAGEGCGNARRTFAQEQAKNVRCFMAFTSKCF